MQSTNSSSRRVAVDLCAWVSRLSRAPARNTIVKVAHLLFLVEYRLSISWLQA